MNKHYTSIRLEITSKCNINCIYCHNSNQTNKINDLTTDEIILLITNLKKTYGINKVLLTGGEPLLTGDILKIIETISKLNIKVDMVTNGTLLNDNMILNLEKAGLKRIRISIDEVGSVTCIRDNISPDWLWNKVKRIKEISNIEVCIHTVCSTLNVNSLFDVYKKVIETGASRWRVFDIGYQGSIVKNKSIFKLDSYYEDLIYNTKTILEDYIHNNYKRILDIEINNVFKTSFLDLKFDSLNKLNYNEVYSTKCSLPTCNYVTNHQISIRSDGNATLCQYFNNPIYEYKKNNFDIELAIKNKKLTIENKLYFSDLEYCKKCKYALLCNGGCRSRTLFLTGNIKDADPAACHLHKMVHNEIMTMLPTEILNVYEWYININGLEPKYTSNDLKQFLELKGY